MLRSELQLGRGLSLGMPRVRVSCASWPQKSIRPRPFCLTSAHPKCSSVSSARLRILSAAPFHRSALCVPALRAPFGPSALLSFSESEPQKESKDKRRARAPRDGERKDGDDDDDDDSDEEGEGEEEERVLAHKRRLGEMAALISNPRVQDPPAWVNDAGSLLSTEQRAQIETLAASLGPIQSQLVTVTLSIEQHTMRSLGDLRPLAHSLFAEWDIGGEKDKPRSILMLAVRAKDALEVFFGWGPDPVARVLPLSVPSELDSARPVSLAQSVVGSRRQASGPLVGGFPANVSGDGEMIVQVARAVARVLHREHNGRRRTLWGEPTICLQPHSAPGLRGALEEAEKKGPRQSRLLALLLQAAVLVGLLVWSAQSDANKKPQPARPPCPRCKAENTISMKRGPTPTTATITCSQCGLQQDVARPLRTPTGDMVSAAAPLSELEQAMGPPSGLTGSPRGALPRTPSAAPGPLSPPLDTQQLPPLPPDSLGLSGQAALEAQGRRAF